MMNKQVLGALLTLIVASIIGSVTYAVDWQQKQDDKLYAMDKLIEKQKYILKLQHKINENQVRNYNRSSTIRLPSTYSPFYTKESTTDD